MPTAIPEITKSRVINQWFFQGLSRDAIAEDNQISGGAVTNIVDDSMDDFGRPDAESMRVSKITQNSRYFSGRMCKWI
jgi:hypothetical protein